MISLHVTIYQEDGNDRFKVTAISDDGEPVDVTDKYEVAAISGTQGTPGFAVFKRED